MARHSHTQSRHVKGLPTAGRFAKEQKEPADDRVELADTDTGSIRHVAAQSGWSLLADVAADLNYQGEVHSDSLQLIDVATATDLGEEYLAPAVDEAEAFLEREWVRSGGGDTDWREQALDVEGLRVRCQVADLPPYLVGFVEEVSGRHTIPAGYLNTLGPRDLGNLAEVVSDHIHDLATRLREIDQDTTQHVA